MQQTEQVAKTFFAGTCAQSSCSILQSAHIYTIIILSRINDIMAPLIETAELDAHF